MVWLTLAVGVAAGVWLSVTDVRTRRLPNAVVLPTTAVLLSLLGMHWLITGEHQPLVNAAVAGVACWSAFFLLAILGRGALGGGDVKFAALLGVLMGSVGETRHIVWGVATMFGAGALVSIIALITTRTRLRDRLPFGPSMLLGALVSVLSAVDW